MNAAGVVSTGGERVSLAESDPRVFFAAERTLLAWLRTGLTIIALGFVIARFGQFVRLVHSQLPVPADTVAVDWSPLLGIGLVVTGALAILLATVQHARFIATLTSAERPAQYSRGFAIAMSVLVGLLGMGLAVYLLGAT